MFTIDTAHRARIRIRSIDDESLKQALRNVYLDMQYTNPDAYLFGDLRLHCLPWIRRNYRTGWGIHLLTELGLDPIEFEGLYCAGCNKQVTGYVTNKFFVCKECNRQIMGV